MAKLFGLIIKLTGLGFKAYAFLATTLVLTQIVLLLALLGKGYLTSGKVERLKAVYTDVDYQKIRLDLIEKDFKKQQDPARLAETEVLKTRATSIDRLASDVALSEVRLREAGRRFELVEESFKNEVAELERRILQSTQQQLRNTLKNMDSAQVKDSLVGIVQDGGLDDVVAVLRDMGTTEQAKVFGEFKSEEEQALLSEILKSIRGN